MNKTELAETTLKKEKILLLEFSDYLSDNRMLRKKAIRKIVEKRASGAIDFIENGEDLKEQIQSDDKLKLGGVHFDRVVALNKE